MCRAPVRSRTKCSAGESFSNHKNPNCSMLIAACLHSIYSKETMFKRGVQLCSTDFKDMMFDCKNSKISSTAVVII